MKILLVGLSLAAGLAAQTHVVDHVYLADGVTAAQGKIYVSCSRKAGTSGTVLTSQITVPIGTGLDRAGNGPLHPQGPVGPAAVSSWPGRP